MRRCVALLAFAALWLVVLAAAWHQPSRAAPPLLPGLQAIADRGKLVVAMIDREVPPFFSAPGVEPSGLDADLARFIGERLGVSVEFDRSADTFDKVIEIVAAGGADVGMSFLSRTVPRARSVLFTRPYAVQSFTLLINRLKALQFRGKCPSVREVLTAVEFSGLVGVQAESAYVSVLREANPDAQPREFQTNDDLFAALVAGEVAMSFQGELAARAFLQKNPAAHIQLRLCEIQARPVDIAIAVGPGQYDLLNFLNVLLEEYEIFFDAADVIGHEGEWIF